MTAWPLCAALCAALTPLEAELSLDISETVSEKAESLSGLSVRGSLLPPLMTVSVVTFPLAFTQPLASDDIVVFVIPDTMELLLL